MPTRKSMRKKFYLNSTRKRLEQRNKKLVREYQKLHNGKHPPIKNIPRCTPYCHNCPYLYFIEIPENELDDHVGIVAVGQKHIGGCKYINKTDDDFDGWGLLWDGCKECNIG